MVLARAIQGMAPGLGGNKCFISEAVKLEMKI